MWIITTTGFYSVVEKRWDSERGTLTVRARVRGDLDALRTKYLPELEPTQEDADADYRYRAQAPRAAVAAAFARAVGDIQLQERGGVGAGIEAREDVPRGLGGALWSSTAMTYGAGHLDSTSRTQSASTDGERAQGAGSGGREPLHASCCSLDQGPARQAERRQVAMEIVLVLYRNPEGKLSVTGHGKNEAMVWHYRTPLPTDEKFLKKPFSFWQQHEGKMVRSNDGETWEVVSFEQAKAEFEAKSGEGPVTLRRNR